VQNKTENKERENKTDTLRKQPRDIQQETRDNCNRIFGLSTQREREAKKKKAEGAVNNTHNLLRTSQGTTFIVLAAVVS
jgi:hypothetical protein